MKKIYLLSIITILSGVISTHKVHAQCAYGGNTFQFPGTTFTPACTGTAETVTTCNFGGDYFLMNVTAGTQYTVATCGGTWDSQITVYNEADQSFIAYDDDGCGLQSTVTWTSAFTGTVRVLINLFNCTTNSTCITTTVTCGAPPPPPVNNDCGSVTPSALSNPGTLTFTGTSAGSTDNSVGASYGLAQVWHAFTITSCANVTINTCGTTPAFTQMFTGISSGCPASFPGNYINANSFDFTTCGDGNFTAVYNNLPAGTYYVPVIGAPPDNHAYTLNVSAVPSVAAPTIVPAGPTTFCQGGSVTLNITPPTTGNVDLQVSISGTGFQDEVGWNLTNSLGAVVSSGGPYAFGATTTVNFQGSNGPFTFNLETQGTFNDNVVNYTVTCVTSGTVLATGTLNGGLTFTGTNLACNVATPNYTWSPATGLNTTTGASVLANPTTTTTYTATATNPSNGCTNTSTVTVTVNPTPTVTASSTPTAICTGGSATITASGASTYAWSPATGLSATTGTTVTANPATTTTYTITGTSAAGCTGTGTYTMTVNTPPTVSAIAATPTICSGGSTSLTASGAATYTWSPATGLSATTGTTVTASPTTTTTYTVTGTAANGCTSTATVTVTVNTAPTVAASASPTSICAGGSSTLTASGAATYAWSPATGLSATTGASVTASPVVTTTYTVTGTAANGCTGTGTVTVTLTGAGTVTLSPFANVCTGSSPITLSGGSPAGGTWSGTGVSGSTFDPNVSGQGTFPITYTVTGPCGGTATQNITVAPGPTITSVTANPTVLCVGNSTQLSVSMGPASQQSFNTGGAITIPAGAPGTTVGNSDPFPSVIAVSALPTTSVTVANVTINGFTHTFADDVDMWLVSPAGQAVMLMSDAGGLNDPLGANYTFQDGSPLMSDGGVNPTGTYAPTDYTPGDAGAPAGYSTTLSTFTGNPNGNWQLFVVDDLGGDVGAITSWGITFSIPQTGLTYNWTATPAANATFSNATIANPTSVVGGNVTYTVAVTGSGCTATGNVSLTPTQTVTVSSVSATPTSLCGPGSTQLNVTASSTTPNVQNFAGGGAVTIPAGAPGTTSGAGDPFPSILTVTGIPTTGVTVASVVVNGMSHTFPGDIDMWLQGPGGQIVMLMSDAGGGTDIVNVNYTFQDGSPLMTTGLNAAGTYGPTDLIPGGVGEPAGSTTTLSSFTGNLNGNWQLFINDDAGGDVGSITSWSINLNVPGSALTYNWTANPAGNATITLPTQQNPTAAMTGTATYTVVATDPLGCTGTGTVTVNVGSTSLAVTPANPTICTGGSTTLTASGAVTYTWSPAAGLSATTGATVTANPATTTTYTVTGIDGTGCSSTTTVTVTVTPSLTVSVTPTAPSICTGGSTTLTASGATSYVWSPASGLSGTTGATVTANPATTTTYTVTGTSGSCSGTATVTVTVGSSLTVSVTPASPSICTGGNTTLTASGATSYTWSPATGLSATTGSTVTANPATTTTYTVTGTTGGCSGSTNVTVTVTPGLTVSVTPSAPSICPGGNTTLTASGGTTYTWSPATGLSATTGATVTANPTTTTTYTVTGTTSGCTATSNVTVTVNTAPTVSVNPGAPAICPGGNTTLTASGASTYAWSPATGLSATTGASVTATPSATTTYTVTGTASNGCTATATSTVTVNPAVNVTVSPSAPTICTAANTTLTASGANTYTWSPATGLSATTGTSVTANPTTTTTYTVTGTSVAGCTGTGSVTVTVNPLPVVNANASVPTVCPGASSTLTATGAASYSWSPATGLSATTGASVTATPATTTTYTVTGTTSGCSSTSTVTVTVLTAPTVNASATPASICIGASSALTASGANTYAWSPATGLSATTGSSVTATPSTTTTYTVTGTAANGCTGTGTVTVTVNPLPTISVSPSAPAICAGASTSLTASGGATYSWSPATGLSSTSGATVTANPSATTTYTVTGSSAAGCTNTANVTVTVNPLPTVSASAGANPVCPDVNTLLSASGANTYTWSPATGLSATTGATVTANISSTTTYTVTGSTASGCSSTASVTLNVFPAAPITVNASPTAICPGGSSTLTASGGTGFVWSPITGLSATTGAVVTASPASTTTYTVNGNNVNGCATSGTVTLTVNPLPTITVAGVPSAVCAGASSVLTASGASTYSWSPATGLSSTTGTSVTATPPSTTTYTVSGTSVAGCTNTSTFTLTVNPIPTISITAGTNPVCLGSSSALTASGAATYSWSPITGLSAATGAAVTATPAATTTYTVTGTSAAGCTGSNTITLSVNPLPNIVVNATPSAICTGGSSSLTATGANSYTWSPLTGLSGGTGASVSASPLNTSTYTVTGTSGNGCTASANVTVTVNPNPVVTLSPFSAICSNASPLSLSGGTPAGGTYSGTGVSGGQFNPAVSGSGTFLITYTFTNANGCTGTASQSITVNPTPNTTIVPSGPFCSNSPLTALNVATPGGLWSGTAVSPGGVFNPAIANIGANTVTYSLTQNGCSSSSSQTVTVFQAPNANITPAGPYCSNASPVTLSAATTGGAWSGPGMNASGVFNPATALIGANTISYTVTSGTCSATDTEVITVNQAPSVSITPAGPLCSNGLPVNLSASLAGGTWFGTAVSASGVFSPALGTLGLNTVTYTVAVGGCSGTATQNITINQAPDATIAPAGPFCSNGTPVVLSAATPGGTWSGNGTSFAGVFTPTAATQGINVVSYSVTLNGCTSTDTENILVNAAADATIIPANPFCANAAPASLSSVTPGGTWSGTGVSGGGIFNPANAAVGSNTVTYTITVGGCVSTDTEVITVLAAPDASISPSGPFCSNGASQFLTAATPNGSWSGPGITTNGLFNPASASVGNNTITYTVTLGVCSATDNEIVVVNQAPNAAVNSAGPFCVNTPATQLTAATAGGTWSGTGVSGTGLFDPAVSGAGIFTVSYSVTANGCTAGSTTQIQVNNLPDATILPVAPVCANATAFNLGAATTGGTWSGGAFVSATGVFTPAGASLGANTVSYSVTQNGCTNSDTEVITVLSTPDATITPAGPFCSNDAPVSLSAATAGGTWFGSGISGSGTFSPSTAGAGLHTITYSVLSGGCSGTSTINIVVNPTPVAAITSGGPYCTAGAPVQLTGIAPGGTFSGPGVSGSGIFTPSVAGVGSHTITYTVTSGACTNSATAILVVNQSPDASITNAGPFCSSDGATNLLAAVAGGVWTGSGVGPSGTFNPSAVGPGIYIVTYSLNIGGCAGSNTDTIIVNPAPNATISGATTLCTSASPVTLTAVTPGGTWSGPGVNGSGQFDPATSGTGIITVTYSVALGACTATDTHIINVISSPDASINAPAVVCSNSGPITLTANTGGGTWTGAGMFSNGVFNPTLAGNGTHVIVYTVNAGGCSATSTNTITVQQAPFATINNAGPFCSYDNPVQLTAGTPGGTWSGNGVDTSGLFTPSAAQPGVNTITYTVTSGVCSATGTKLITVNLAPNATIGAAGPYCEKEAPDQLAAATPGGFWSGPGVTTSGLFNPAAANIGSNLISYTITQNGCTSNDTVLILVNPLPTAIFDTVSTGNLQVVLNNLSVNATSYNWSFGDGQGSILTNPTHQYIDGGIYTITLTANNACGSDIATLTLVLFKTNNSIEENAGLGEFNLWPNPADEYVNVTIGSQEPKTVRVSLLDVSGRVLQTEQTAQLSGTYTRQIDLSRLPAGSYFVSAETVDGRIVKRLIKIRK